MTLWFQPRFGSRSWDAVSPDPPASEDPEYPDATGIWSNIQVADGSSTVKTADGTTVTG